MQRTKNGSLGIQLLQINCFSECIEEMEDTSNYGYKHKALVNRKLSAGLYMDVLLGGNWTGDGPKSGLLLFVLQRSRKYPSIVHVSSELYPIEKHCVQLTSNA